MSGMERIAQFRNAQSAGKKYVTDAEKQDILCAKKKNGRSMTCTKKVIAEHVAFSTSLKSPRVPHARRKFAEHAGGKDIHVMKTRNHHPPKKFPLYNIRQEYLQKKKKKSKSYRKSIGVHSAIKEKDAGVLEQDL